ncbi:hypothetical protein KJ786_00760 [Patescibacteria group bacterium]|nr:hypothetical protein [Patescibacteria group bacterium]
MKTKRVNNSTETKEKIENKIIDWVAETASGKLTIVKPPNTLVGTDIIIKKRGEYYDDIEIHLQIRECEKEIKEKVFINKISEGEYEEKLNFYFLFSSFDIVAQDISEYLWLIPADKFFEIADEIATRSFQFKVPIDVNINSNYSKYLIEKRDLANVLIKIINDGGKLVFPETGFSEIVKIKPGELKEFITEARSKTFAGGGVEVEAPRLKGSKEMEYQKGDWFYRDVYFNGQKNLIGQEVIYYNSRPVWGMGYFGDQLSEKSAGFLKQALLKLADKCRFGEKCEIEKKEFRYEDNGSGDIGKFFGEEKIFSGGKNVYKLNYQGGLIYK